MSGAPPSRLAVHDADIDWDAAAHIEITLDGTLQEKVIEYDCEAGFVERYAQDESGNIVLNDSRDEAVVERVYGTVTVAWKKRP